MNIDIQPYIKNIEAKQEELLSMLHDNVSSIILPTISAPEVEMEQPSTKSSKTPLVLGGAAIVGGLFLGDPLRWICVGVGLISVFYAVSSSKKKNQQAHTNLIQQKVDLHDVSSRISRSLRKINDNITSNWDEFISAQKNTLKNAVLKLDIDIEEKDKLMNSAISSCVIEFSMQSFNSQLRKASTEGNIQEFADLLKDFEQKYKKAIEDTCRTQKEYWISIN